MKLNRFAKSVFCLGFALALLSGAFPGVAAPPVRARVATPVSADAIFSSAVRAFWSVEPRQPKPFLDYERLTKREVLPAANSDTVYYRNAALLFERFIAATDEGDERLPIAHYFAGMAWFRIGAWKESLLHIETVLQKWPEYSRPRLNERFKNLRRPVKPDLLHLRFYIFQQLQPQAERLKTTEPLRVLDELGQQAAIALDEIAPRDAQWRRMAAQPRLPLWAELDVTEPQPDQLRAAALPAVDVVVENAYNELLSVALQKNGAKAVRVHLRELQSSAHFAALGQKLLLGVDAQIIKSYFAEAQKLMNTKNFDGARAKYRQIIAEYPDSESARKAEAELPKVKPIAIAFYKQAGTENFKPAGNVGVAQTKAREYFEKLYNEDPNGPEAPYALYYWSRALWTEGNPDQGMRQLHQFIEKYPNDPLLPNAMYSLGFMYGGAKGQFQKMLDWLKPVAEKYPNNRDAPEALWHIAFILELSGRPAEALPYMEKLRANYPNSFRWKHTADYIADLKERIANGGR